MYVVHLISFQTFLYRHLKFSYTLENSVCYCYTCYEMTDQFLWFRFKWTATAAIGIHPTRAWMLQQVNFKNAIWTLEERSAIKFCFRLGKNAMRWKLDLLLWPRGQETEFPEEACWFSQTQKGQTEQIHPQTFDDPFFWQHWHDLHALGSHLTDSQQGILCWGFKGVQEEIPW